MNDGPRTDERDLIVRYRAGDEQAFRVLFERHLAVLERRIRDRVPAAVGRRVSVVDILQETRIVAYRRRADFVANGPDSFRNWLLGIVDNKAQQAIRRHAGVAKRAVHREKTRGQRADTAQFRGREPSPSQHAIANETAARARRALATLPPDYREVLRLARDQGMALREVAEHMGRSREAVKKLYGRALVRFRHAFESASAEDGG